MVAHDESVHGKGKPAGNYHIFQWLFTCGVCHQRFPSLFDFFVWMAGMEGQVEEDTFVVLVGLVADD